MRNKWKEVKRTSKEKKIKWNKIKNRLKLLHCIHFSWCLQANNTPIVARFSHWMGIIAHFLSQRSEARVRLPIHLDFRPRRMVLLVLCYISNHIVTGCFPLNLFSVLNFIGVFKALLQCIVCANDFQLPIMAVLHHIGVCVLALYFHFILSSSSVGHLRNFFFFCTRREKNFSRCRCRCLNWILSILTHSTCPQSLNVKQQQQKTWDWSRD